MITLKIGHVSIRVRVVRVDYHLPINWTRDLHPTIDQSRSRRCTTPRIIGPDVRSLWQEVGQHSAFKLLLTQDPPLKELFTNWIEGALQFGEQPQGLGDKNLRLWFADWRDNPHTGNAVIGHQKRRLYTVIIWI